MKMLEGILVILIIALVMVGCDSTKKEMYDNLEEEVKVKLIYNPVVKVGDWFEIEVVAPAGYTSRYEFMFDVKPDDFGMQIGRLVPNCDWKYRKAGFYHGLVRCWDKYHEKSKQEYFHVEVIE